MKFLKKLFNTLFGRLTIFGLLVILQVAFIVWLVVYFEEYSFYVNLSFSILALLIALNLNFRYMPNEAKVSWCVLLILFPAFGIIAYLMFSRNYVSLRQKRFFTRFYEENVFYLKNKTYKKDNISEKLDKIQLGQLQYLESFNANKGYTKNQTTFFPSGEEYFEDLLKELKTAEKFIFIEFFIVERGQMLNPILDILKEKVKQGVEVRLVYDDIGSIKNVEASFYLKLRKMGIKAYKFNRFIPIASAVHNNRDHRKFVIIDGKTFYTGGCNIADEYINKKERFGYWKDSMVKIKGPAVDSATVMFLTTYMLLSKKNEKVDIYLNHYDKYDEEGIVCPYGDGPRPFYKEYIGENVIINMINQSENYIYITTPYFVCDDKIKQALINASKRGVDVRIIVPHIPDKPLVFALTRSNYARLQKAGVKVYEFEPGFVHAKQIVCDDKLAQVGTINLDYRSLLHHYEDAVWFANSPVIKDIKKDFEETFPKCIDMTGHKQNKIKHFLCKLIENLQPLL
jgi:cardiolipin synthase A/B